ncbi:MAG: 50S ribosomal protein L17, partial [Clostridia bacterium]|nr:50S ribosomal protein L17 [Clostridia bacterium]
MAIQRKLGKPTDQRTALLRNQVTELLWNGKIETTLARAKEVAKVAEKLLTAAINTYTDTVKKVETRKKNDKEIKVEVVNDGP